MSDQKNELKSLFAISEYVKIADKNVEIKAITLEMIPDIVEIVGHFDEYRMEQIKQQKAILESQKSNKKNEEQKINVDISKIIQKLIVNHKEKAYALISNCTDLLIEQVPKLNLAAAVKILSKVFEVNWDFLEQNLMPEIDNLTTRFKTMADKTKNIGQK